MDRFSKQGEYGCSWLPCRSSSSWQMPFLLESRSLHTSMVAGNIAFFPCTRGTLCKQNMKQPSFGLVSFGTVKEDAPCAPNLACQKLFPCCGCQGGPSMMMRLWPMFQCSVVIGCISLSGFWVLTFVRWWRLRRPEKDPNRVTHACVCLFFF